MPLVTLTVHDTMPQATRRAWLDAVHTALVSVGVPPTDRFQRVLALGPGSLIADPGYPDTETPRDERMAWVEVLWSVGRSVKVKRQFLKALTEQAQAAGLEPEQLLLVFKETAWENWSFAGGRLLHT